MPSPFHWPVCAAGYFFETRSGETSEDAVLKPVKPWPTSEYEPLRTETALFRRFADLKSEPNALLQFANRFGALCGTTETRETNLSVSLNTGKRGKAGKAIATSPVPIEVPGEHERERPETLTFWKTQIAAMQEAVGLWELVREEKADPLKLGSVAEAVEAGCKDRIVSRYEFDRAHRRCEWMRVPRDLLGALWLQFADAVSLDKEFRRCPTPECGDWYEVSPAAKGPNRTHCSLACKQRAYRLRKQRALELFMLKWSADRIAKELNTNVDTIKGWLTTNDEDEQPEEKTEKGSNNKKGRGKKGVRIANRDDQQGERPLDI